MLWNIDGLSIALRFPTLRDQPRRLSLLKELLQYRDFGEDGRT
jgi:hypothetical protein